MNDAVGFKTGALLAKGAHQDSRCPGRRGVRTTGPLFDIASGQPLACDS
jgi:hypothetical protein